HVTGVQTCALPISRRGTGARHRPDRALPHREHGAERHHPPVLRLRGRSGIRPVRGRGRRNPQRDRVRTGETAHLQPANRIPGDPQRAHRRGAEAAAHRGNDRNAAGGPDLPAVDGRADLGVAERPGLRSTRMAVETASEPDTRTAPTVRLRGAELSYPGRTLWRGLDLDVAPGEFLAVPGPDGCGETRPPRGLLGSAPRAPATAANA